MYVVIKINMFYIEYGRWKNKQDKSILWGFFWWGGAYNVNIVNSIFFTKYLTEL